MLTISPITQLQKKEMQRHENRVRQHTYEAYTVSEAEIPLPLDHRQVYTPVALAAQEKAAQHQASASAVCRVVADIVGIVGLGHVDIVGILVFALVEGIDTDHQASAYRYLE